MDPAAILITTTGLILLVTWIYISFKTGVSPYIGRTNQVRFEARKDQIGRFIGTLGAVLLLNIVFGLVAVNDNHEFFGVLMWSVTNTFFISLGLAFGILLQEKKGKN